jgi:GT2 family glycosyltransferase
MNKDNKVAVLPVLMINYNGDQDTIECLDSLLRSSDQIFQIIIIDNSPSHESLNIIHQWGKRHIIPQFAEDKKYDYPFTDELDLKIVSAEELEVSNIPWANKVLIIKTNINNGFAAANNVGLKYLLKHMDFQWVWLLNNDTTVPVDCIKIVRAHLALQFDDVGIVGTKIFYYHNRSSLQGVAGHYNPMFSITSHVGAYQKDYTYDLATFRKSADFIMGASMIVKRNFIEEVGLMDEDYFLYYEELDWALRGKAKGWQLDLIPEAYIFHKEGATISKNLTGVSLLADKCSIVNRLKITRKFFPGKIAIVYLSLLNVFYRRIKRGQSNRIIPILKAIFKNHPL